MKLMGKKMYSYFLQDSAIYHKVHFPLAVVKELFDKQLVTHLLWLATDPDLIPRDHNLCETIAEFMWIMHILCRNLVIIFNGTG